MNVIYFDNFTDVYDLVPPNIYWEVFDRVHLPSHALVYDQVIHQHYWEVTKYELT